jgi:hypothetical protein
MGLETGNTIADLNSSWPLGSDPTSQGDDHIRLIKRVLQNDVLSLRGGTMTGPIVQPVSGVLAYAFDNGAGIGAPSSGNLALRGADDVTSTLYYAGAGGPDTAPGAATILSRKMGDGRYLQQSGGTVTGYINSALKIAMVSGTSIVEFYSGETRQGYVGAVSAQPDVVRLGQGGSDYLAIGVGIASFAVSGSVAARVEAVGATAATAQTVMTREKADARYLNLIGGTMTGPIVQPANNAFSYAFDNGAGMGGPSSGNLALRGANDATSTLYYAGAGGPDTAPAAATILSRKMGDARYQVLGAAAGAVGSYAMLKYLGAAPIGPGSSASGSDLRYSSAIGEISAASPPSGTWRCMGYSEGVQGSPNGKNVTLYLRVS